MMIQATMKEKIPRMMADALRWIPLNEKRPVNRAWGRPENWKLLKDTPTALCGYVLTGSGVFCLDFDKAIQGGKVLESVKAVLRQCKERAGTPTYVERSMSGTGLHVFYTHKGVEGQQLPFLKKIPLDGGAVLELYTGTAGKAKQIAMTGDRMGHCNALADGSNVLPYLLSIPTAKTAPTGEQKASDGMFTGTQAQVESKLAQMADELAVINRKGDVDALIPFILSHLANVKQEFTWEALFADGDLSRYNGDHSRADQALMNMLPFWTGGNPDMMQAIFRRSALARDLDRKQGHEADYLKRTIKNALRSWDGQVYNPRQILRKTPATRFLTVDEEKQLAFLPDTDTGNAERLNLLYGNVIKYLPEKGRGAAWMKWNGKKWDNVYESDLYNLVSTMAERSFSAVEKYMTVTMANQEGIKKKQAKIKFLQNTGNQKMIDACLKRSRGMFAARVTDFDKDPFLLNVQNGIIDLKTGELHPHARGRMCSKICRAEYHPDTPPAPLWVQTIKRVIPNEEERHYLQKWAGYLLLGNAVEEKLLFLYGEGGSGKGTFINTIGYMMGDYADTIDIEVFLASRNDGHAGGSAPSPEIAKLAGVRAAIASESGLGRKLNDAKVKNMTGRDDITARYLYGQQFTFSPVVKFVLQSNYLPSVVDATDSGIRRRLVIAPFNENLDAVRDPMLKERLKAPENMAAVLKWCLDGCRMWQQEGLGKAPKRFEQELEGFYASSDTLQDFIDEACTIGQPGSKARVSVKMFCDAYRNWTRDDVKRKTVVTLMKRKGYNTHRFNNTGQCFIGIELNGIDLLS